MPGTTIAGALHERIRKEIKRRVAEHQYEMGDRLPSASELAKEFGVSLITIARALCDLQSAGVVDAVPGRGTFVRESRRFVFDIEDFLFSNFKDESRYTLERSVTAASVTRGKIAIPILREFDTPNETMRCVRSMIAVDGMPTIHDVLYVPLCFGDKIVDELEGKSVGEVLRGQGVQFDEVKLLVGACPASDEAKVTFGISDGFPTLRRAYQLMTDNPSLSFFGVSESPFDRLAFGVSNKTDRGISSR
ncbi:DNA-binding GntR family transcriptional regulator [Paraburkholderia sp. BL18I3N2]|uniref:GntR family transcriptional regulator n=1 Tax=unclassified Paraburkholderia TaxID=2615204 RepID=UPI000D067E9E|nr:MULTISPECIES: GntR family transcriptional regulator [unclassified Paraburkholderia]PRX23963.1 DNA-binding GntR family transcriptional regulator [Paraburkholderia sp. BL18I3N2]PRX95941.1 DNA-binding GntR family transcriptional regulator [Paraburkholderia sp. BL25I1N1]TDY15666.1 DNA-binding GntR family transcriptional regulator [Paraburkholderia sp. BL6665CI2N2]